MKRKPMQQTLLGPERPRKKMESVGFKMDSNKKLVLQIYCAKRNLSLSELLLNLIDEFIVSQQLMA